MTKKIFLTLILSLVTVFSFAQYVQDFEIENQTGVDIYFLYASPVESDSWEEDILGDDVLLDGDSTSISFSGYPGVRYWDLMIEDIYGNEVYWESLDLFTIEIMTLEMNAQGEIVAFFNNEQYVQDFILENQTGVDIFFVYASPVESDSWEEDILGEDVLFDGDWTSISFSGYPGVQYWDIMVVDEYDNEVYWEHVDLFSISEMVLEKDLAGNIIAIFY